MHNWRARGWRAKLIALSAAISAALAVFLVVALAATGLLQAAVGPGSARSATSSTATIATSVADLARGASEAGIHGGVGGSATPSVSLAPLLILPARGTSAPVSAGYTSSGVGVVSNVPFTNPVDCGGYSCQVELDIYSPAGSGPFPTAVLVRGGPSGMGGRSYLASFAGDLANQGILVFSADYRDAAGDGGGFPAGFQDVACAIRFARSEASRYDGNASPITLVGHSLGSWVGSVVALDQNEFGSGCLAGGSGRPDAFVGLAGNYQIDSGQNSGDLYTFFGGSASETAAARAASNPFNYATGTSIPVRLVAGTADGTVNPGQSIALHAFLLKQGWDVRLTLLPGDTHMSILGEPSTYDAIFSAIAAASSLDRTIDSFKALSGR